MTKQEQLEEAIKKIRELLAHHAEFTGSVRINFFKAGVSNINVEQSIKISRQ